MLKGIMYTILGIVALVIPETMMTVLGYFIGIVLIVAGAVSMISYLLRDAYQNYYHNDFLYGLFGIGAGIVVLYNVQKVVGMVPVLLGVLILVSGASKLQDVIDMVRLNYGNPIVMLVLAAVNLVLGFVLIFHPFEAVALFFKLIGIGLIFSGVTDAFITVYFARRVCAYRKAAEEALAGGVETEENRDDKSEENE